MCNIVICLSLLIDGCWSGCSCCWIPLWCLRCVVACLVSWVWENDYTVMCHLIMKTPDRVEQVAFTTIRYVCVCVLVRCVLILWAWLSVCLGIREKWGENVYLCTWICVSLSTCASEIVAGTHVCAWANLQVRLLLVHVCVPERISSAASSLQLQMGRQSAVPSDRRIRHRISHQREPMERWLYIDRLNGNLFCFLYLFAFCLLSSHNKLQRGRRSQKSNIFQLQMVPFCFTCLSTHTVE